MTTPYGTYQVLRQKTETTNTLTLSFLIFGFWVDQAPEVTTSVSYEFYNKDAKGRLLSYTVDSLGFAGQITYSTIPGAMGVPPVAGFDYTDQGNSTFQFTDASYDDITSWAWDFGDGASSTMQNPTHTYAMAGDYTVCLTVTNPNGTDQLCRPLSITAPPQAAFTFTDQFDGLVNFTDASANGPDTWLWDFADGNTSTEQNPSHTFAAPGAYNVCLTVSNAAGSNMTCQMVNPVFTPEANFTYVHDGTGTVTFTDASSNSPNSWAWDFGDGEASSQQNPNHDFASGIYDVCLTASNVAGVNQHCEEITVIISSTEELEEQVVIEVFPNPATRYIQITTPDLIPNSQLKFYNQQGQEMLTQVLLRQQKVDLAGWASGTYRWTVIGENGKILRQGAVIVIE